MKYLKLKFLLIFAALAMAIPPAWARQVTDVITANDLTATGTSYKEFSGLQKSSPAVYQGITARTSATGPMQWNNKNNCGIVSTTSGGTIVSVTIEWDNSTLASRVMNIYGSNTAYTSSSDLYGDNKGTKIEALTYDANNLTQTATFPNTTDYKYVGIVPSNAQYINSITIVWEVPDTGAPYIEVDPEDGLTINDATGDNVAKTGTLTATLTNGQGDLTATTSSSVWSWNNNTATFAGYSYDNGNKIYLPLHDKATVTFSSTGATDVTANLEYNYTGPLYIIGTVNGGSWSANNMVDLEGPDADGIYTATFTSAAGDEGKSWISFSKRKGTNWDSWNDIKDYRFTPLGDTPYTAYWLTEEKIGEWIGFDFDPDNVDSQPLRMDPGTYTITIDAKNNQFKIERYEVPVPKVYNKVVDASQLVANKNYIIVYEGDDDDDQAFLGGISTASSTPYGISVSGPTINDNSVDIYGYNDIRELTLSGNANGWSLHNGDGYLHWSGSKNSLSTETDISDNSRWTVTGDAETGFILTNVANSNRVLKYNATSGQERFACYTSGQQPAVLYVQDGVEPVIVPTVATPTFNPAGGTYTEVQNVEISCTTDGAIIYYTTDGNDPTTASTVYSTAIPVNETKTIKAFAVKEGMQNSAVAEATYTINLPITVSTLAAANALEEEGDDVSFTFTENDVVVTFNQSYETTSNNGNIVTHTLIGLRDKSENKTNGKGGSVFFDISDEIANNLTQGTVLNPGWKAKTSDYSGWVQLKGASSVTIQDETVTVKPFDRTGVTLTAANQSEYIILNNVTINGTTATAGGSKATYTLFNRFNLEYGNGDYEYLIGVVNIHNNSIEIYPLEVKKAKVVTPTFNPGTGEYTTIQNVEISCATQGATISYKIGENGEWKTYTEPIEVAESCTIYAKATKTGMDDSDEASATYTINLPTLQAPTFDPEAGTYDVAQNVAISATNEAAILYKIGEDGEWATYSEPIKVEESCTIFAKASKKGYIDSEVNSAAYVIRKEAKLSFGEIKEFTVYPNDDFTAPTLTTTPEGLTPITYSIEGNDDGIVEFDESDGTVVIGEKTGTVIITASFDGNDTYTAANDSYKITVEPKPYLVADETVDMGTEKTKEFDVVGENLKGVVTLTCNNENFVVTPTEITPTEGAVEQTVTVTYNGSSYTDETATITVASQDAESVIVTVKAHIAKPALIAVDDELEFEALVGKTDSKTFYVTGENLKDNVTLTLDDVNGVYSIDPTSITKEEAEADGGKKVTVTYTPMTENIDDATITVASTDADPVTVTLTGMATLPNPVIVVDDEPINMGTNPTGTFDLTAENLRGNITLTSDNPNFTVEPATITPEEAEDIVTVTVTYNGNDANGENATITITTEGLAEPITITVTAQAETKPIAAPTFAPAGGTYTEPKEVAIACATPGVTITYAIDGVDKGEYNGPFTISDGEHTVTATAMMGTRTVYTPATSSATYKINVKAPAAIENNYYNLINNGLNNKFANVAGRRTLNFVDNPNAEAGTIFRIATDGNGKVLTLRSQACDIQDYAKRAMNYVPVIVQTVINKLNNMDGVDDATGPGNILGENGLKALMDKFNECFDYNLYVEGGENAYRIYARTPSMQNVVDFYAEHKAQVDEKLPMLEGYINQVLAKIRSKVPAGMNANVFEPFSLLTVWEEMGGNLIKPDTEANVMKFYEQVLTNKEYVWNFAYTTAKHYLNNIQGTQTYRSLVAQYPDINIYVSKMEEIRPETKFFIIQNGNEPDYVSETHSYIKENLPMTYWTLNEREKFTVNVPEANKLNDSYYTTLYTDFGYELPEGVEAYAVTGIDANDVAQLTEITGTIPAQTPVLLKATAAGNKELTLKMDSRGGAVEGNLLEGPDYLIKEYGINSPTVEMLFTFAEPIVPADMLEEYAYLKLRTSGTVNNKYFWNVNDALDSCTYKDANNEDDCVVRSLAVKNGTLAFSEHWTTENNKAFLVSDTKPVIYLEKETLAAPTFSPVPGSYTVDNGENVTITITAEDDATIYYKIGDGEYQPYEGPITASDDMTIVAKAEKDGMIASNEVTAVYVIDNPTVLPDVPAMKGYYQIKNNGNNKYANVAGRKTLNFKTETEAETEAGTVIWLETNGKGQVQSIRSQAADLQRYADRAMTYVPDIVEIVADKLNADGVGNLLGHEGLEKIMEKFKESFDHHLYVEQAESGYRLYGKTPSMQPVVEFYRENQAKVEAKLPMLEQFINDALDKLKEKLGGQSVFTEFNLHDIWQKMGGTLTEPTDDASTMAFYREVLNNKNYVWDFAYQTAMIYVNNLTHHPRWEQDIEPNLGEYAQYINMIEQVRPDFKYYVVQKNDKPDFISEGNTDIINNADRTIWTLEERENFKVNIDENNLFGCPLAGGVGGYATTLYTDFAYELPEGVTAYKVTSIEGGKATIEALSGIIPAQTPVLLTAKETGAATLTLKTEAGTADMDGNLLVGPDYLINEYDLKTEQVQSLFDQIKQKLGQDFYDTYVAQYEYLADLNSGTVNNKYFWGLKESDVEKCSNDGGENCVVRNLSGDKFIDNWKVETNKAFLVTDEYAEITFNTLHGDVNHDGLVNIEDVTDLIDRLLGMPDAYHLKACEYCSDVNKNGTVKIDDVTTLIDILLGIDGSNQATDPQGGE